jgi:hypothetical protein
LSRHCSFFSSSDSKGGPCFIALHCDLKICTGHAFTEDTCIRWRVGWSWGLSPPLIIITPPGDNTVVRPSVTKLSHGCIMPGGD